MEPLEQYFEQYRRNVIGMDFEHSFVGGKKNILYADWTASGRLYRPIEEFISNRLGPYVANTHTETTLTGTVMTDAYQQAHEIIKTHVHAAPDDILLFAGFGMTSVINKFQRILGLCVPDLLKSRLHISGNDRPLVIITHMEHHSNQITWEECLVDVAIIRRLDTGLPDLDHLRDILQKNQERRVLIGSFTACSNVTGIVTPYHQMAEIVHEFGGHCFVDFSASAPYVNIVMHPPRATQKLDAIFFSPHKFLGGPGSSGVIVFDKSLYRRQVPDQPGGGTVLWTNPWGSHRFYNDIEVREDGGTPGFLQATKAALAILLKEKMGIDQMLHREHLLKERLMNRLAAIPGVYILEPDQRQRLGLVSLYAPGIHHHLLVRLLNDRFGIQTRGGCSCAGTYGHVLLNIDSQRSKQITDMIDQGDLSDKPGWVRISLHPVMRDTEVDYIADSLAETIENFRQWSTAYKFDKHRGDFELIAGDRFRMDLRRDFQATE